MKKLLLFACFLIASNFLFSQIGVSAGAAQYRAQNWFDLFDQYNGTDKTNVSGFRIGVDYWFRLKSRRIEFMPEISLGTYVDEKQMNEFQMQVVNFQLNTNIYLLDLDSDCNCPTFNKQGNFFTKGFFVQASVGLGMANTKYILETPDLRTEQTDKDTAFNFGGGVGVDIGLSELITLTPFFKVLYYPEVQSNTFLVEGVLDTEPKLKSSITEFYAGIRLGIRWDKRNY